MKITFASLIALSAFASAAPQSPASLFRRTTTADGTCGNVNSGANKGYTCGTSYKCCSQWGWCGDSDAHCGTGCQPAFGSCTGSNPPPTPTPPTPPTPSPTPPPSGDRSKPGNVPYGVNIYSCTVPGTVALTFDDGPYAYTDQLIALLNKYNAKATFFINGQNWGNAITEDASLQNSIRSAYNSGHQIASHTWSHADLDTFTWQTQIKQEFWKLELALVDIIGRYPTYARAPYFNCGSFCQMVLNYPLAYHLINTNCDTNDWLYNTASTNYQAQNIYNGCVSSASGSTGKWIVLNHDVHATTVQMLVEYEIKRALELGYKLVTVGTCLGDPPANWYRTL